MNVLCIEGTCSWIIAKSGGGRNLSEVFHARPGRNKAEAWANATQTARTTKREFVKAGWKARRIYIDTSTEGHL